MNLAENIAQKFGALPQVEAVTLAGSRTAGVADPKSDFDLYVYITAEIPLDIRRGIAAAFAERIEINNQFWEPGDEWIEVSSGIGVDIMYRQPQWLEEQIDRVLVKHQAAVGYSTCFWYNVLHSKILFDRRGWFAQLQQRADQPYPEPLRRAIVAKNYPILRRNISSYLHQIECAVARHDAVSVQHRAAALLASYFDILFALNRLPHPGEKRLVEFAKKFCALRPAKMEEHINLLIGAGAATSHSPAILHSVNLLIDGLESLLLSEELL
ncbi:MAG: hypothetical protein ALAOOOJD_01693 [bacterium]|nr:hypothetical protein [bacterium]